MNYEHPAITIECPVPGHYCISGHRPQPVMVPGRGHLVPPGQIHLPPELPDEALLAVLEDRRASRETTAVDEAASGEDARAKRSRARRSKAAQSQAPAKEVGV